MLRPEEIKIQFDMLPPQFKQGVSVNDPQAMQIAIEKAQMQAVMSPNPNDPAKMMKEKMKQTVQNIDQIEQGTPPSQPSMMAQKKNFNLKRFAQSGMGFPQAAPTDPFGAQSDPAGVGAEQNYNASQGQNQNQYNSHVELSQELSSYGDPETANSTNPQLVQAIAGNESAQGAFDRYFSETNEENKLELAKIIYDNLPPNMKSQQADTSNPSEGMTLEAPWKQAEMYGDYLNEITASIQEIATKYGQKKRASAQPFNLKKTAQHQGVEHNTIMWGPSQTRPDPFLRGQPVSDWHIMERNKGFGGDIDGVWNIDWEAVWRGNIMDKYSRPYRDTTTGEWIGGYIQKRFEVDKMIPVTNNYQLLPGQKRKPYLPEYASTEARLQAMRNKNDGNLGRVFNDTSKPFNWHKASQATKIKTAEVNTASQPVEVESQTDVTTEKQLKNVSKRPGILGLPSIQRHEDEPAEIDASSNYKNNYGDPIENKAASGKKKTDGIGFNLARSTNKTAWLDEGRPLKDLELKPLEMMGEKPKDPLDSKHFCQRCHGRVNENMTQCPNCHAAINSESTNTGVMQQRLPEAPAPKLPTPGTNVKLNEVLFDSRTGRFIIADSVIEYPDQGFMQMRRTRKRFFPDLKDLPRTDENMPSKEFKQIIDPHSMARKKKVDNVSKSCTDLAIDG